MVVLSRGRTSFAMSVLSNLIVFVWFSATSFFHGYLLLLGAFYMLPAPLFAFVFVAYGALMFLSGAEHTGKATLNWFRDGPVTRAPLEYFNACVVGAAHLDSIKGSRCLFGFHPHGIYPMAGVLAYAGASPLRKACPWLRIRPCAASILFRIPLIREYLLWTGHLDAGKRTLSKHMRKGEDDLALVIGGEKEALLTQNGKEKVVLLGRTGFVQLACQYGYHLVPTYAFGQNELYTVNETFLAGLRATLQRKAKVSIPFFWGRFGGPMPYAKRLTLAIGKPILVPKPSEPGAMPDPALVEAKHAEYIAAVKALFEEHKAAAGYGDRQLEIVAVRVGKQQ